MLRRRMNKPKTGWSWCSVRPKDPFPAWSHWAGALLALVGAVTLLSAGVKRPSQVVALAIYGVSLVLLYIASMPGALRALRAAPRSGSGPARLRRDLRRDRRHLHAVLPYHAARPWGWVMLAAVWATAVLGITLVYAGNPDRHWPACSPTSSWAGWWLRRRDRARCCRGRAVVARRRRRRIHRRRRRLHDRPPALSGPDASAPTTSGTAWCWSADACHFLVIAEYVARA